MIIGQFIVSSSVLFYLKNVPPFGRGGGFIENLHPRIIYAFLMGTECRLHVKNIPI